MDRGPEAGICPGLGGPRLCTTTAPCGRGGREPVHLTLQEPETGAQGSLPGGSWPQQREAALGRLAA